MDLASHLLPTKIQTAHFTWQNWCMTAPPGVTAEHVRDPDFWVHLAARLKVNDRIEIVAEDGSFDMDLRVIAIDPGIDKHWARMRVLREYHATSVAELPEAEDGLRVQWGGPHHRWRVMRGNELIERDHPDQASAAAAVVMLRSAAIQRRAA